MKVSEHIQPPYSIKHKEHGVIGRIIEKENGKLQIIPSKGDTFGAHLRFILGAGLIPTISNVPEVKKRKRVYPLNEFDAKLLPSVEYFLQRSKFFIQFTNSAADSQI